jgi:hypothetical protein
MPTPKKWYPPTIAQEWKRICEDEDKAILEAYVRSGDPAAIVYKQQLIAKKEAEQDGN